MSAPLVEVKQLVKQYGSQYAVRNVSFSLKGGEVVGFLGPNGAGKSTTMKIMTSYILPDDGECWVGGVSVIEDPLLARRQIGYLPESNPLYPDLYVEEYLDLVGQMARIPSKVRHRRIAELIEVVGLVPERHKKIGQLSKGFRQRVGLIRALLHDPPVLILDEPTSGLDPNQVLEIRKLIRSLAEHHTILFSSHHLSEVEAISTRIIIIHQGRIVMDAPVSEISKLAGKSRVIYVEFVQPVEERFFASLRSVRKVVPHGRGWRLHVQGQSAVEATVFYMAAKAQNPIFVFMKSLKNCRKCFGNSPRKRPFNRGIAIVGPR